MHTQASKKRSLSHALHVSRFVRALKPMKHDQLTAHGNFRLMAQCQHLNFRLSAMKITRGRKAHLVQIARPEVRGDRGQIAISKQWIERVQLS
jgi:hypothetical protein